MRVSLAALSLALATTTTCTSAFTPTPFRRRNVAVVVSARYAAQKDLHEFDYLLNENGYTKDFPTATSSRRQMQNHKQGQTILASSTTVDGAASSDYDPFSDDVASDEDRAEQMFSQFMEQPTEKPKSIGDRIANMGATDLIVTVILPAIIAFKLGQWSLEKGRTVATSRLDGVLDKFAAEMVYHDGNFEEMKLCHADFSRRLFLLGPKKTQLMLEHYLQMYTKKKTVSPQAIASLSYVFSLFGLSEESAANIMVTLCKKMGTDKISSAGKVLFFGSRILKSPEGKAALAPIKTMIKSTYRDSTVAETIVESSQLAMAEAAYRAAVQAGGKKQTSLTIGWEVLGLDKENATRIFDEEADKGFVTDREKFYGTQSQRYDDKGRKIDKEGKLMDKEEAAADAKEKEEQAAAEEAGGGDVSGAYECSECGMTMFIAKGRESKFYGSDFKCPNCGASKDKMRPKASAGN